MIPAQPQMTAWTEIPSLSAQSGRVAVINALNHEDNAKPAIVATPRSPFWRFRDVPGAMTPRRIASHPKAGLSEDRKGRSARALITHQGSIENDGVINRIIT